MASRKPKKDWLKQLQKKKLKRFEGLKSRLNHGPYAGHQVVVEPAGQAKMSEVLEDFLEPYMDFVVDEATYRKLLSLGVLAWNAALLSGDVQKAMIDDVIEKGLTPGSNDLALELRSIFHSMIERKLAHFASNRRAIISFELTDRGRDFHLSVASTIDASPAPKSPG